ncbi:MAG: hypothetical protein V4443_00125 [Pseudomonadota bacterium]
MDNNFGNVMTQKKVKLWLVTLLLSGLSGCGGGGGGSASTGPVSSSMTFPLQSAFKSMIANGRSTHTAITISGNCTENGTQTTLSGNGTLTVASADTASTFDGTPGFSADATTTLNFYTNCPSSPFNTSATTTNYYDSNYTPLGFETTGSRGVYQTSPPLNIPTSVVVSDTGEIGTITIYTVYPDNSQTISGTYDWSYVIEADTATTAIVNSVIKNYNNAHTLIFTVQERYRISAAGPLIPVTTTQDSSSSHLVLTFN